MFKARKNFSAVHRGMAAFTLVEVMIIVAIIGVLLAIAIPNYERAQTRGNVTKAKSELRAIQTAVENYYLHHSYAYPANLTALTTAVPNVIKVIPDDPFASAGTKYGYVLGGTANAYYIIYSKGPAGSGSAAIASDAVAETNGSSCIYVSNMGEDLTP